MLLSFERGSAGEPKAHALVYFKSATAPDEIYASYLIVPPIAIDLMKYMPPMFAGNISMADMQSLAAIPLPPIPEKVTGLGYLRRLSERRDDDLLFLGTMNPTDIGAVMAQVSEAAQEYLRVCKASFEGLDAREEEPTISESVASSVEDVLYSFMSERDKLGEMAKLVGKLRYAMDGNDKALLEETAAEMEALSKRLPEKYRAGKIIGAAKTPGIRGRRLAELHVSRCYKLCDEDYRAVEEIDVQIREMDARA